MNAGDIRIPLIRAMFARLGDNASPGTRAQFYDFLFNTMAPDFRDVEEFSDAIRDLLVSEGMIEELARWNQTLGRRYWIAEQYDKAEAIFRVSLSLFRDLGREADAASSEHNLGLIFGVSSRSEEAEAAYLSSLTTFARLRLYRMHATCSQNLGALYLDAERIAEAEKAFQGARNEFLELGLIEHVARADLSLGFVCKYRALVEAPGARHPRLIKDALNLLIPALLFLDSIRLTLPDSPARSAWISSLLYGTHATFDLAAQLGNANLIAQLVEATINTGVHSVKAWLGSNSRTGNAFLASQVLSEWLPQPERETYSQRPKAEPFDVSLPGAAALIAGRTSRLVQFALLPVGAPPTLRMPDGSIALEAYIRRANEIYGTSGRSKVVINTW